MEVINELELRNLLKSGASPEALTTSAIKHLLDEALPWDEKRSFWHYLYLSGREATLAHALVQCLKAKTRVPFDLIIQLASKSNIKPTPLAIEALLKGVRKQSAQDELIGPAGWDRFDKRFEELREEGLRQKQSHQHAHKGSLLEKFEFLQNQRMTEQAGRVLRRMTELYPDEKQFAQLKVDFEEQWARDVLSDHQASVNHEKMERTVTAPSTWDEAMLSSFAKEGEAICVENRELASDLAIAFWFMEDYNRALDILAWAEPTAANDWLKVEVLVGARRFIEAMELLNQLEIKYINDPETTFAVAYVRAQCLNASGQETAALEILRGIVSVRPSYRSVNALLQEWSEGAAWE